MWNWVPDAKDRRVGWQSVLKLWNFAKVCLQLYWTQQILDERGGKLKFLASIQVSTNYDGKGLETWFEEVYTKYIPTYTDVDPTIAKYWNKIEKSHLKFFKCTEDRKLEQLATFFCTTVWPLPKLAIIETSSLCNPLSTGNSILLLMYLLSHSISISSSVLNGKP